jgi:soluble lytic murein transglycosylase-like protein
MMAKNITIFFLVLLVSFGAAFLITPARANHYLLPSPADLRPILLRNMPHPKESLLTYSIWRTAPLDVAKVFGRSPGCADADSDLIEATAKAAVNANLDPSILAATVATESGCNPYAVSSRGAVGLTQIMPRIWASKFDFSHDVNLFNQSDSLRTGAAIMADSINHYGVQAGIQRYNGVGVGCDTCDGGYATRILALAGKR